MPRVARASVGGICYDALNRANARETVFHEASDYDAFLQAIGHACVEIDMPVRDSMRLRQSVNRGTPFGNPG